MGAGDALDVVQVELHVAVARGVHLVGGVEALPPDGQHHAGLRRPDGDTTTKHVKDPSQRYQLFLQLVLMRVL